MMTDAQLHEITANATLFVEYGDRFALSPDDVSALVAEVQRCRDNERHLIAMVRQRTDALNHIQSEAAEIVYAERGTGTNSALASR